MRGTSIVPLTGHRTPSTPDVSSERNKVLSTDLGPPMLLLWITYVIL